MFEVICRDCGDDPLSGLLRGLAPGCSGSAGRTRCARASPRIERTWCGLADGVVRGRSADPRVRPAGSLVPLNSGNREYGEETPRGLRCGRQGDQVRDDGRRARIVAAVTDRDSTTGVAELMQRLCLFAVDQMALSGCALVLMSGTMRRACCQCRAARARSPPCRWNWAKAPAWMPMPPGLRCCCRTCRPGTRTAGRRSRRPPWRPGCIRILPAAQCREARYRNARPLS